MRRSLLQANLSFLHGTMQASEDLLRAATRKSRHRSTLRRYFSHHLAEEKGHLKMLETDLKALGVTDIPRFPEAAQLAGAQYYYIEHRHPALLLGYMAALECRVVSLAVVDDLEAEHGPLSCVRHHAAHDPAHGAELMRQIEQLEPDLRLEVRANEHFTLSELTFRITPLVLRAADIFQEDLRHGS